ncbi:olfactory receptor 52D1 [Xenopus tropicalis]|uniref:Olfactory receptor 52D1 n=1 Tax=Xenopus tropicalis TaxID=8364 RepID=A0A8J1J2N8_XENTR|nr:olfactory receptor 52D1 [Xenopus tropicalis]
MILGFGELTSMRYVYLALGVWGYLTTVLSNVSVITVILIHKALQEPMYIFICALCFNGLYGSLAFYPGLFINLLQKVQTISYTSCILQVFAIHTYGGCEMTLLAVMALDRYVCICDPLRYNSIMSLAVVYRLIVAAWFYSFIFITIHIILTVRLTLCDSAILKIYCDNWSVVRLSCIDTTVNNTFGMVVVLALMVAMPSLIFISYMAILRVCVKSSQDFRAKALKTCTPHLITITNFIVDVLFEIFLYRFTPTAIPYALRVFMSVHFLVAPPLLNPLIYGLKIREIRVKIIYIYMKIQVANLVFSCLKLN